MPNGDMKYWRELEESIAETVKEVNDRNSLVVSLIATLNRLNEIGDETRVHRNEHGEMYIVVGNEFRISCDLDSMEWYTADGQQ